MATITITVPDAVVPDVLAAFRFRWPQLVDLTDAQAGKQGVILAVRAAYESASIMQRQQDSQASIAATSGAIT